MQRYLFTMYIINRGSIVEAKIFSQNSIQPLDLWSLHEAISVHELPLMSYTC